MWETCRRVENGGIIRGDAGIAINVTVLDWWVVSGGGAPSSGDGVTMNGTLGQPIVGLSSDGDVSLSAGYWGAGGEYLVYLPLVLR